MDEDWQNEEVWERANPNLGVSVSLDYLRTQAKKAVQIPAYENTFRRLHLDQWTEQDERWLPMDKWKACGKIVDPMSLMMSLIGKPCFGGIDMSSTADLTGCVLVFPIEDEYHVLWFCWVPKEGMRKRYKKDRVPYPTWASQGYLKATEGDVVDYDVVREHINILGELYDIQSIGFDTWNATQLSTQLISDGFDMVSSGFRLDDRAKQAP
jgi:phage terminase large subunit-like protein